MATARRLPVPAQGGGAGAMTMWFWRRRAIWPEKSRDRARWIIRHADLTIRKLEEGARYLLIANGAVLVAIIGAIGGTWKEPQIGRCRA